MIPEPSKLQWSYERPTFEEVKGKCVHVIYASEDKTGEFGGEIFSHTTYTALFGKDFVRYAILDMTEPEPEPKALWGKKPVVEVKDFNREIERFYVRWGSGRETSQFCIISPEFPEESAAILAWNNLVDVIENGGKNE